MISPYLLLPKRTRNQAILDIMKARFPQHFAFERRITEETNA